MPLDPSRILTFSLPGDTDVIAMTDAGVVAIAKEGLTDRQKAALDAYLWTPTTLQLEGAPFAEPPIAAVAPQWAGNDPPAVYYKTTEAKMRTALAKFWREVIVA